jgi:hypothetical protein
MCREKHVVLAVAKVLGRRSQFRSVTHHYGAYFDRTDWVIDRIGYESANKHQTTAA